MEVNKKNPDETREDISKDFSYRPCGIKFDDLGNLQKHITIEYHQKGTFFNLAF